MLGEEGYVEIHVMHRQGMSIKAIGRELGISRNTVRKYLRAAQVPAPSDRSAKPTKLDAYRDYLNGRVEAARPDWIPATVLFDEIVALGYQQNSTSSGSPVPSCWVSRQRTPRGPSGCRLPMSS